MRIAIIHTAYDAVKPSGHGLRVETIKRMLDSEGFTYSTFSDSREIPPNWNLYIVVSFSNIRCLRHIPSDNSVVWLDSIDSLFATRIHGLGRLRMLSYIKGLNELFLFLIKRKQIDVITYISKADKRKDNFLNSGLNTFVFPNDRIQKSIEISSYSKIERCVFIGDFAYNANRNAVYWLSLNILLKRQKYPIHIYGNPVGRMQILRLLMKLASIHYHEYGNISDIYKAGDIHLAPIWNSVGIKNKITDPINMSIPVLCGEGSDSGLVSNEILFTSKKNNFFTRLDELMYSYGNYGINLNTKVEFLDDERASLIEFIKTLTI